MSQAHRDVPHDRQSYLTRQPRRDPGACLYQVQEDGFRRPRSNRARSRTCHRPPPSLARRLRRRPSRSASKNAKLPVYPPSRCAMPVISAASATDRRWQQREGLVSVHFVNAAGSVLVAPYGGVERRLSTAPSCVGIPRQGQRPIVLDFATSIVAEGKVLVASRGGKKLPKGALIDLEGTLSCCTDRTA